MITATEWLEVYLSFTGFREKREDILEHYDIVRCDCDDTHCRGWKLESKPRSDGSQETRKYGFWLE